MCSFSADIFRSCSCGCYVCLANVVGCESQRNGNVLQVHSDESKTDIKSGIGADFLNGNRVFKIFISGCCKASAGLRFRNNADNFIASLFRGLPFKDKCAVEVFTALGGKKNSLDRKSVV